jgi:predicted transcriptional regulator
MIDFACKQLDVREVIKCGLGLTRADLQVLEAMLARREWRTSSEIAAIAKLDLSTVQRSMKRLREKKAVERRQHNLNGGGYEYSYRIGERGELRAQVLTTVKEWAGRVEGELDRWCGAKTTKR